MVNFKLPLLLFAFASTACAASVPRAPGSDALGEGALNELVARQTNFGNQLTDTINKRTQSCQPHVTTIQNACKGKDPNVIAASVKVEINAVIAILVALLADIKALIKVNAGVKIDASVVVVALTALLQVLVDIVVAIRACISVSIVINLLGAVLGLLCTAYLNVFVALQVCLNGLVALLIQIAIKLGLTLAILIQLKLNCLIGILL